METEKNVGATGPVALPFDQSGNKWYYMNDHLGNRRVLYSQTGGEIGDEYRRSANPVKQDLYFGGLSFWRGNATSGQRVRVL